MSPWHRPFVRRRGDRIQVRLPAQVTRVVLQAAEAVRRSVDDPAAAGHGRLLARTDESAPAADPLVTFERQVRIGEAADVAAGTWRNPDLSEDEAEAWLQVLGMALGLFAEERGLRTEEDRAALGRDDEAFLSVVHALQLWLASALDAPRP